MSQANVAEELQYDSTIIEAASVRYSHTFIGLWEMKVKGEGWQAWGTGTGTR